MEIQHNEKSKELELTKKLAVLGNGFLAGIIVEAYNKGLLEEYELTGILGRTKEKTEALAEKGGIAGLNYCASFVDADSAHPKLCRSTVERLAKHAAHFKQVGGIEVISLGSDFDGIGGQHELETAADMPLLAEALRREGFTEDEVEAIYWRNAYRFFKNNL